MQIVFCRKVRGAPNSRRRADSVGGSFRLLLPERRRAPWRWPRSGGRTGLAPISRSARIPRPPGRGDRRRAGPSPAPARQALLRRSPAGGRSREGVPIPERRRGKRVAASPQSPCGPLFPGLSPRLGTSGPGCAYRDRSLQLGPLFRPVHSDDEIGIADKHRPLRQPVEFGHGLLGNELHDGSLTDHFHLGAGLDHLIENPVDVFTEFGRGDLHDPSLSYVRLLMLVRTCACPKGPCYDLKDGSELPHRQIRMPGVRRCRRAERVPPADRVRAGLLPRGRAGAGRRPTRHTVPSWRMDRPAGGPPCGGQSYERLRAVPVGAHGGRTRRQTLRSGGVGGTRRRAHRTCGNLLVLDRQPPCTLGGAGREPPRRRLFPRFSPPRTRPGPSGRKPGHVRLARPSPRGAHHRATGADGLEIARRSQNRTGPRRVQWIKSGSGAFPGLPRESEYNEFKAPEFSPPMSSRWKYLVVSTSTCLTLLFLIGSVLGQGASTQEDTLNHMGVVSEVVARIQREYVEEPDMRSVSLGALNGMLEAIDPFASYLNADQYRDYLKNKDVKRSDVGLILSKRPGYRSEEHTSE